MLSFPFCILSYRNQGKADVSFTLNEDLTSLSAFGEKAALAPLAHPMTIHSVGGKTLAVFTESSAGNSQLPCSNTGKTTWRYGSFEWITNMKVHVERIIQRLKRFRILSQTVEYEKRKKAEGRMVRAYRQQVMDMLFSAFEEHQYYNIKDLLEVAKQPATYLKEILREIGVYNAKGTHKSTWELKPEYHHYQGRSPKLSHYF
uniref:General transcription factor IIF subunit 2 n=1 Tax=Oncorhynchus tshawytscha TaxID=74940 RepID=A0A8C8DCG7_ONCTS